VNLTVYGTGDLNFMGSNVTNNGTIEVKRDGNFDMTNSTGGATATDGKRMTNNGKFIHNVDAGVGTAVQKMNQNGEYRCKVDDQIKLDDAFLQWTACSVIEIVADGNYNLGTAASSTPAAYKHKDYIDIEITNGANVVFTNPGKDKKDIQIGNLTVTDAGTLNITYAAENDKDKQRTLTINGDMTVNANATISSSKMITVKENLTIKEAALKYVGAHYGADPTKPTVNKGLDVKGNITVIGDGITPASPAASAEFDASDVDALNITCKNFYLEKNATATFGNRTDGAAKNLVVRGTISNPEGCYFNIYAANQDLNGSVLAWVTCKELKVGGTFSAARPRVE